MEMRRSDIKRVPGFSNVIQKQGEFIRHVNVAILTLFWKIGEHVSLKMNDLYLAAIEDWMLQDGKAKKLQQPFDLLDPQELKFYGLYHHLFGNLKFPAILGGSLTWEQLRNELLKEKNLSNLDHFTSNEKGLDNFTSLQNNVNNLYSDDFFVAFDKLLNVEFDGADEGVNLNVDATAGIHTLLSDFKKDTANQLSMQLNITFWQIGQSCIKSVGNKQRIKDSSAVLSQYNPLIFSGKYLKGMIDFAKQYPSFDQAVSVASSYYWHQIEEILSRNSHLPNTPARQGNSDQDIKVPQPLNTPEIFSRTETEKGNQVEFSIEIIKIFLDPATAQDNEIFTTQAFKDMYLGTTRGLQITFPRTR